VSARCGSCGALIAWVRTAAGKRMPIDFEPTEDGNVVIEPDGVVHVLKAGEFPVPGEARHTSHFATCPKAAEHRRR
jgi:hypothetical protein